MIRDLENEFGTPTVSILNAVKTADGNGTGVDLRGYTRALILCEMGNSGDTLSGSLYTDIEVEESDDNSTFTDVADADLQTSVTGTNTGTFAHVDAPAEDSTVFMTTYNGTKRYIRVVVNVTGTHSNGTPIAACIIPFGHRVKPS
jgi:hypothetical protein